jgi:alpha-ketoglutarate-dependent taurine dioxygenase
MLDPRTGQARYDQKYIAPEQRALGQRLGTMLSDPNLPSTSIKLAPGEILFFNNRRTLHARTPYSDPNRRSIRTRMRTA